MRAAVDQQATLEAWLGSGGGCTVAVGCWAALADLEALLRRAEVTVIRVTWELVRGLDDPHGLAALETAAAEANEPEEGLPASQGGRRAAVRQALEERFTTWLEELASGTEPVALRDLELAVASRLPIERLAALERPLLVLAPGRLDGGSVWIYPADHDRGVALPPALSATHRVWDLHHDAG